MSLSLSYAIFRDNQPYDIFQASEIRNENSICTYLLNWGKMIVFFCQRSSQGGLSEIPELLLLPLYSEIWKRSTSMWVPRTPHWDTGETARELMFAYVT